MAMLASIGDLPDTIMDRAVVIRMRRRAPGEQVDPYRTRRDAPPLHDLRDRLTSWAREHLRQLQHAAPVMPLEDRAADTWEPLIALADLAQGDWPERARQAAVAMTRAESQQEEDSTASVRLLADLRDLFDQAAADALYTTTILERLHKIDDAPWADWYGHPLTTRDLAKLLRPYQTVSKSVREGGTGEARKGYHRSDLHEPWSRYLPSHGSHGSHDGETAAQACAGNVSDSEDLSDTSATAAAHVTHVSEGENRSAIGPTSDVTHVTHVTHPPSADDNGWRFNQPLASCVVCGTGTSNRAPSGKPLHLGCPHPEQDWSP
jgi:Protein of unknown function (DUF3631)